MAWRSCDPLFILYGHWDLNVDVFHSSPLLNDFFSDFGGNLNCDGCLKGNRNSTLDNHLNSDRHVNLNFFLNLGGNFDLNLFHDKGGLLVLFLDGDNVRHLNGDLFGGFLRLGDLYLSLDHGRHLDGDSLNVLFGDLHLLSAGNNLDFGG